MLSLGRSGTKTFCCDSKTSDQTIMGNKNKGTNCKPSATGQCNPGYMVGQNYKFRCFNVKDQTSIRPEITDGRNLDGDCTYVTGTLGKVGTVAAISGKTLGTAISTSNRIANNGLNSLPRMMAGVKRRRKTRKGSRKNRRKTRKN